MRVNTSIACEPLILVTGLSFLLVSGPSFYISAQVFTTADEEETKEATNRRPYRVQLRSQEKVRSFQEDSNNIICSNCNFFFFLNTRFISFHSISETVIKNWSDYSTGKKVNSEFGNLLTIGNCKQFDPSLLNSTKINRRAGVQRSFTTHIC